MKSLSEKRILLTGASGFIGKNLLNYLIRTGAQVGAVCKENTPFFQLKNTKLFTGNLQDNSFLKKIFKEFRPNIVYHLAALVGEPISFTPAQQLATNASLTLRMLEESYRNGVELFIFPSSAEVYGNQALPFREEMPPKPLSFYGASKAAAENYVLSYHLRAEIKTTILRLFSVYGPGQKPTMFIPQLIQSLLKNETLSITQFDKKRDYIYVSDVAEAFLKVLESPRSWGEIINIGSGKSLSLREIVEILEEITEKRIKVAERKRKEKRGDVKFQQASIEKAKAILNWEPTTEIKQGLEKTIEWQKNLRNLSKRP